jgi:hypothetical protein
MTTALTILLISAICFIGAFLFKAIDRPEPNHWVDLLLKCAIVITGAAAIVHQLLGLLPTGMALSTFE